MESSHLGEGRVMTKTTSLLGCGLSGIRHPEPLPAPAIASGSLCCPERADPALFRKSLRVESCSISCWNPCPRRLTHSPLICWKLTLGVLDGGGFLVGPLLRWVRWAWPGWEPRGGRGGRTHLQGNPRHASWGAPQPLPDSAFPVFHSNAQNTTHFF